MNKYLGIDVGGTKVKYGLYFENGEAIETGEVDTEQNDLNNFIQILKNIKDKFSDINGMGISLPCVLNDDGFVLESGNIKALENINIKEILKQNLNINIELENDANCVALAEKWLGNTKENSNFICVTIGTGIGGAIFVNDKLHKGAHFIAGEIGFMIVSDNLNKDYGHLASTNSLIEFIKESNITNCQNLDGKYIFEEINKGNKQFLDLYEKWITYLAIGIRNLCFVLDPEKILIGGGVSKQERILKDLKNKLTQLTPKEFEPWEIDTCKFFNNSGVIGAIYNFIQKNEF